MIFRRYVALRSVRLLAAELAGAGVVSKARRAADGRPYGAQPLGRGALYAMLANRLYRGEVAHRGEVHPGEHEAIVDGALFAEAQAVLAQNRVERDAGGRVQAPSLLTGLVYDAAGERLTPTHATKRGVRYRYYVSARLITGTGDPASETPCDGAGARCNSAAPGQRIPVAKPETVVTDRLRAAGCRRGSPRAEAAHGCRVRCTEGRDAGTGEGLLRDGSR